MSHNVGRANTVTINPNRRRTAGQVVLTIAAVWCTIFALTGLFVEPDKFLAATAATLLTALPILVARMLRMLGQIEQARVTGSSGPHLHFHTTKDDPA